MGFWQGLLLLIKYLPELIELAKRLENLTNAGVERIQISLISRRICAAFDTKDPVERARLLNEVFRK